MARKIIIGILIAIVLSAIVSAIFFELNRSAEKKPAPQESIVYSYYENGYGSGSSIR